jgi:hypothetical protein
MMSILQRRNDGFRFGLGNLVASLIEYAANKAELHKHLSDYFEEHA